MQQGPHVQQLQLSTYLSSHAVTKEATLPSAVTIALRASSHSSLMSTSTRGSSSNSRRPHSSPPRAPSKKYKARGSKQPDPDPDPNPDPDPDSNPGGYWDIWDILDEKKDHNGRVLYRVKWKDHPVTGKKYKPSWEPEEHLTPEAIAAWDSIKRERTAESSSRASTASRVTSQNSSPVPLPGTGRKRSLQRAADGDSSGPESADLGAVKRRRIVAPKQLPGLRPEPGQGHSTIRIELLPPPDFDPSEYRAITESQSTQATQGASQPASAPTLASAPAPAPVAVTRDVTAIIPDSQEVSGSDLTNGDSRLGTQKSQGHLPADEQASTSEIPSHQPEPYPPDEVEILESGLVSQAHEPPSSEILPSCLDLVFLTQIPFSFGSRGHTSPAVEAPSSPPEEVGDVNAPQHPHTTALDGSSAFSQAAQFVNQLEEAEDGEAASVVDQPEAVRDENVGDAIAPQQPHAAAFDGSGASSHAAQVVDQLDEIEDEGIEDAPQQPHAAALDGSDTFWQAAPVIDQPEEVEDATALHHSHATAFYGSGASSQAAQIVGQLWAHNQEISSPSQASDFSVYSDGDVVPQSVPRQSGEQQASQESSQALSELNGNTRVPSSFRDRETAKSQPHTPPTMDDNASTGTPPLSAAERLRQLQQRLSSQTRFDFDIPTDIGHDLSSSASAPPRDPRMSGAEFSLPLVSPMLVPSVELEREPTPPVFGSKQDDAPLPAVAPADSVVDYGVVDEPATLDPSALTLSIEHEPVRSNSITTDDGLPSDGVSHEHEAALLADETSKPLGQTESQECSRNILPFIRTGPNEHLITLPLANNMRSLYYEITREYLHDIEAYTTAFAESSTKLTHALVSRVDAMLSRLYDICDLPPFLETLDQVLGTTSAPKHIRNSNSKFAFVGEFIEVLKQLDSAKHILILARPGRTMELLDILVQYEVSRPSEVDGSVDTSVPYVSVKSTRENLHSLPANYDAVIAFDHTFRPSMLPKKQDGTLPMVMALVISASVQHIDLRISEKPPELERKNMLLMALCRARQLVENPDPEQIAPEPHTIATSFARYLESPNDDFYWTPQELPDSIFEDINASSQIDANPSSWETNGAADRETSRKRSREIVEELAPKRRKTSAHLTATAGLAQLSDAVRRLLGNGGIAHPEAPELEAPTVLVPVSRLEAISAEMAKLRSELASTRKQSQRFRDLSDRSQREVKSWTASVTSIQRKFMAALGDRGTMEKERDASRRELESLTNRFNLTTKEKTKLEEENAELKRKLTEARDALMSSENPDVASMARMQNESEEARGKNAELEKKLSIVQENLDFVRERYQQASNSGAGLSVEKTELERRIEALDRKADENVFRINQMQAQNESRELARQLREQKQIVRDREAELNRVKEQLGAMRSGRRETRQSSVPRSPRLGSLGVLSPRAAAGRGANTAGNNASGAVSRGASPTAAGALDAVPGSGSGPPGPGLFGQNTGSGRYAHLRD